MEILISVTTNISLERCLFKLVTDGSIKIYFYLMQLKVIKILNTDLHFVGDKNKSEWKKLGLVGSDKKIYERKWAKNEVKVIICLKGHFQKY